MMASLALGIETATNAGGVALAGEGGRLLLHDWSFVTNGYSRRLMGMIDAGLRRAGARKEDLAAIAVSAGPGSFTGVRVGLITAKTLARALDIPLYPFSTLEMLARRAPIMAGAVCVILDARRREVFSAIYRIDATREEIDTLREERVEPCERTLDAAEAIPGDSILFTGSGAELKRASIEARFGPRARFAPPPWNAPAADVLALAGARALARGEPGADPIAAGPRYIRPSDAEVNLAARLA